MPTTDVDRGAMIVAHLSDPHVLDLRGVPLRKLLAGKRCTGAINLLLLRRREHRHEIAQRIARDIADRKVDHVVLSGDVTNLSLDAEFERAAGWLAASLGMASEQVSIVPGNHDRYTRKAVRTARFERWLGSYVTSDSSWDEYDDGPFPVVRLRGPLAIIGLDSAVPRAPFVAAGELGARQRDRLEKILSDPRLASRTAIVALHHPPFRLRSRHWLNGLRDWQQLGALLRAHPPGLLIHGHLHRRMVSELAGKIGSWLVFGATSASLDHRDASKVAGYNEYVFSDDGELMEARARVIEPATGAFETRALQRVERPM